MAHYHIIAGGDGVADSVRPGIRTITFADVVDALRRGYDDFWEKPSHYVFLCLIYPVAGVVLGTWASGHNALPLVYPLISGFALLGPLAAIGLYEISRRRERGADASWRHVAELRSSPALPSIVALGAMLFAFFLIWLVVAQSIFAFTYGEAAPDSLMAFLATVLTTWNGWALIVVGNAVGLIFAIIVLSTTVIAFPLLLDRDVGVAAAMQTSARAVAANPRPMAAWGLIVAGLLAVGSIPLLAGLAIVIPILGHGTWHLYRKVVVEAD